MKKEEIIYGFNKKDFDALMSGDRGPYPKSEFKIKLKFPNLTSKEVKDYARMINSPAKSSFTAYDLMVYFSKLNELRNR